MLETFAVSELGQLAEKLGTQATTVRNWHSRGAVPADWVHRASELSGKPIEWLLRGETPTVFFDRKNVTRKDNARVARFDGPSEVVENLSETLASRDLANFSAPYAKPPPKAFHLVPRLDLAVSAGPGAGEPDSVEARSELAFSPAYMHRHFGRAGEGFAMLYVKGDSMTPTLRDGDEIVIDCTIRSVDRDGIYVFRLRGDHRVKRIQLKLDGSLLVKSDNEAYEQELIGAAQADEFQVEGRLVYPRLR